MRTAFLLAAAISTMIRLGADSSDFKARLEAINQKLSTGLESGSASAFREYAAGIFALEKEFPKEPEVYAGLIKLAAFMQGSQAEQIARHVRDSQYAAPKAKNEAELTLKKLALVGKPYDLKFTALDGREIDLQKLKGKVVLLDVWATWCPPCVQEMPHLRELYEKNQARAFEIIGISLDRDENALKRFVAEKKIAWPQRFDGEPWENSMAPKLGLVAIPATWLIDRHGIVRYVATWDGLEAKIDELLQEK